MTDNARILIVDDDDDILTAARLLLRRRFGEIVTCRRPEEIPALLRKHDFDAVLLDMNFGPGESSGRQGLEWLERILQIDPQMVVVMITAHGSVDTVVDKLVRLHAMGVDHVALLINFGGLDDKLVRACMERISKDVIPAVQARIAAGVEAA